MVFKIVNNTKTLTVVGFYKFVQNKIKKCFDLFVISNRDFKE